jgi:hypothetical protein
VAGGALPIEERLAGLDVTRGGRRRDGARTDGDENGDRYGEQRGEADGDG